jgi:DNA-binding PadR family transcriptional regulator
VFDRDLREGRYRDDDDRLDDDLRSLVRQGLVESRTITADHHGHSMRVLALSDDGRDLLQDHRRSAGFLSGGSEVRVHSGFGKRSDLIHNASLYRMYQVEAAAIERRGGTIRSVVLEGDLKCEVYHRAQPGGALSDDLRHALLFEAAHRCEIPVVNDHLEFPDIRVEYDMPRGHGGRVDLELITAQYRGGAIAAKAAAGFTMYSAGGSASRGIHGLGGSDGCRGSAGHWYDRSLSGLLSL